ncbi:MAG: HEWD family protein [Halobaculum sp.]
MSPSIRQPSERLCERCGRREEWNDADETWRVDGDSGTAYCIHEWDINGSFLPVEPVEG